MWAHAAAQQGRKLERGTVGPTTFTLRNMPGRIDDVGDLWADMKRRARSLKRAKEKLRALAKA